jgi:hypothetical protein
VVWWYAVVEAAHELQNPTSGEKIRLLGSRLGLGPSSEVLDVASGKAGPAVLLASEFGCRITCVERAEEFHAAAVARVREAGLESLVTLVHGDAAAFPLEPERWDAALCLGASFVWDGLDETLTALTPAVRARGFVAVGEPYARVEGVESEWLPLADTVGRFSAAGLEPVSVIAASEDDWDRYETLHWLALDGWLAANPDHPQADEFRARGAAERDDYLRRERAELGWAIVVGLKR